MASKRAKEQKWEASEEEDDDEEYGSSSDGEMMTGREMPELKEEDL